jgi:hypothetical protein
MNAIDLGMHGWLKSGENLVCGLEFSGVHLNWLKVLAKLHSIRHYGGDHKSAAQSHT